MANCTNTAKHYFKDLKVTKYFENKSVNLERLGTAISYRRLVFMKYPFAQIDSNVFSGVTSDKTYFPL